MTSFRANFVLVILIFVTATFIFSDDSKLRVTASKANIRLRPTTQSAIVSTVPLGGVLEIIKKEGKWYFVKLPPDEKGIVVTGYIHQSLVEVFEEIEQFDESRKAVKKVEVREEKQDLLKAPPEEIIPRKETTKDLGYLKWKTEYDKAEANFLKWKKYYRIGMFTCIGVGAIGLPLVAILAKENFLVPSLAMIGVGLAAGGLWIYAADKRGNAAERMELLMNRGKIKGYIGMSINPVKKQYAVTFAITF